MATITILKEFAQNKDLIAVPRNTYEEFIGWLKKAKSSKTFKPTNADLKAIERARKNFTRGNYITLEELENEMDRNS